MTTITMAIVELAENGADIDVLRQMVQFMAQRLMELGVEGCCSPERLNSRNGYRDRLWKTRASSVELKIRARSRDCAANLTNASARS